MSKPVGELAIDPEPSPATEHTTHSLALEAALENTPPYVLDTLIHLGSTAIVHLYTDYDGEQKEPSFAFTASVSDKVSTNYRTLDDAQRNELVFEVREAMAQQAQALDPSESLDHYFDESTAIMENTPLFFEPNGHAMLRGLWRGKNNHQLRFEANDHMTEDQRRILLGGFAVFVTQVERQNS